MSKFQDAADNIKRLSVVFQGLIEIGAELEKIESIDNQVIELNAQKDKLLKEVENIGEVKSKAQMAANKRQSELYDILCANEAKAEAVLVKAREEAVAVAEQAEKLYQAAQNDSQALAASAKAEVFAAKKELSLLNEELFNQQARLDSINKQIAKIKSL